MRKNLNILMVSDSFYPIIGGREHVVHGLLSKLSTRSTPLLLTGSFKGRNVPKRDTDLPYRIVRCKSIRLTKNEYLNFVDKKTKKAIREFSSKIDIIHTQTKYALASYAIKLGKKLNVPVVTTCHTDYPSQYKNQLKFPFIYKLFLRRVRKTINRCHSAITISNHMKDKLIEMGIKTQITVIPNGNDLDGLQSLTSKTELVEKFKTSDTTPLFIFVGRITETKNLTLLLNALKIIKESGVDFKMLLVGAGEIDRFSTFANKLGIGENCVFADAITNRTDLASLYKLAKLNLFPSTIESFGLTVREAGSIGVPSVVIENSAPAEDITHNVNGYISSASAEDYAKTILFALSDKNLPLVSENAKNLSQSWDTIADLHIQEYNRIIEDYNKKHV